MHDGFLSGDVSGSSRDAAVAQDMMKMRETVIRDKVETLWKDS